MTAQSLTRHILVFRSAIRLLLITILIYLLLYPSLFFRSYQELNGTDMEAEFRKSHMKHPPPLKLIDFKDIHRDDFDFNIVSGKSVMVFLHIQKTGGTTFGKHLVQDIDLEEPCTCESVPKKKKLLRKKKVKNKKNMYRIKCECLRPSDSGQTWLFSRYSTGWKCGLHPDWTELTSW